MHGASKRGWAGPIWTGVVSFAIVVAPVTWVLCALLGLCVVIP
jgi:hypothetical protein